ncbi:toll/interleukin-1 receptor domain-containing protein [Streptomyces acidiscabies]|uniref:toll/interleukin-1 receptor domain-containing protein n=1 Tax=Streptomyces acidiscabies TaxID=42234 RepID=UPI00067DC7CE|nr:toll/interleukin-1 receptor domain-containing protein [Streptomyces acidiscabies]
MIFVNYRTNDEEATATLVERELSRVFGDENVFRASKSIPPGGRFPQELLTAARHCRVLLALIGPRWAEARTRDGRPALEDPEDWTRREIFEALETGAHVIPLLVGNAARLRHDDLPAVLEDLADCQYRRFSHRNAEEDLARLVSDLVSLVPELAAAADQRGGSKPADTEEPAEAAEPAIRAQVKTKGHRQRGGIGNVNGDFSGTFVSEPQGPVHTGKGNLYHGSGDGGR